MRMVEADAVAARVREVGAAAGAGGSGVSMSPIQPVLLQRLHFQGGVGGDHWREVGWVGANQAGVDVYASGMPE